VFLKLSPYELHIKICSSILDVFVWLTNSGFLTLNNLSPSWILIFMFFLLFWAILDVKIVTIFFSFLFVVILAIWMRCDTSISIAFHFGLKEVFWNLSPWRSIMLYRMHSWRHRLFRLKQLDSFRDLISSPKLFLFLIYERVSQLLVFLNWIISREFSWVLLIIL
jgi:hypothetical protein